VKIYEKYLLKLLFSRFGIILFCTSIFGIFQEMSKGELLAMCSFNEMMLILPLTLPMLLFQFLPFIYLGTLILVMNEIYSNNELISFKVIGLSNIKLMRVFFYFSGFMLFFFVFLGILYPATNKFFYKQRNMFGASNVLKVLQPNKMNRIGKYNIFFTDIDENYVLQNVSILAHDNKTSVENRVQKVIYSKNMSFGYNSYGELIAKCDDSKIIKFDFTPFYETNNNKSTEDNILITKNVINNDKMDVLFENFFSTKNSNNLKLKQKYRQTGIITLYNKKEKNRKIHLIKQLEIQGRFVIYWFVILCLTAICCILLKRQTNRIPSKTSMIVVILFGGYISLSRAFFLEPAITANVLILYYLHFIAIFGIFLIKSLINTRTKKVQK